MRQAVWRKFGGPFALTPRVGAVGSAVVVKNAGNTNQTYGAEHQRHPTIGRDFHLVAFVMMLLSKIDEIKNCQSHQTNAGKNHVNVGKRGHSFLLCFKQINHNSYQKEDQGQNDTTNKFHIRERSAWHGTQHENPKIELAGVVKELRHVVPQILFHEGQIIMTGRACQCKYLNYLMSINYILVL